nr:uncharacterized protein LOC127310153 [Lolium perenne]
MAGHGHGNLSKIDQDLVRSDFVELNQELGNEFLNETNWGIIGLYHGDKRERQLLSCDALIPLLDSNIIGFEGEEGFEEFEEVQGQISQPRLGGVRLMKKDFGRRLCELGTSSQSVACRVMADDLGTALLK